MAKAPMVAAAMGSEAVEAASEVVVWEGAAAAAAAAVVVERRTFWGQFRPQASVPPAH